MEVKGISNGVSRVENSRKTAQKVLEFGDQIMEIGRKGTALLNPMRILVQVGYLPRLGSG
jgi:hypothetical protein